MKGYSCRGRHRHWRWWSAGIKCPGVLRVDRIPLYGTKVLGPVTFVIPEEGTSVSALLMLVVKCVARLCLAIRWLIHTSENTLACQHPRFLMGFNSHLQT